jgi:uncharacterized membrane protein
MSWRSVTPLIILLALSIALVCLRSQSRTGLWLDEVYSLELSLGSGYAHRQLPLAAPLNLSDLDLTAPVTHLSPLTVWQHQQADSHPPGYFIALQAFRLGFGDWPWVARAFSAVFWVLTVLLVFAVGWLAAAPHRAALGAGLAGAAVMALSLPGVWYASEIRHYTLGLFWTIGTIAALVGWSREPRRSRLYALLVGVSALGAALTHYFLAGPVVGAIVGALVLGGVPRRLLLATTAAAAAVFTLAWGPSLLAQLRISHAYSAWILAPEPISPTGLLASALGGIASVIGSPGGWTVGLMILVLALLATVLPWRQRPPAAGVVLGALLGAILLPLAADLSVGAVHTWQIRYLLFALPPLALLAALLYTRPVFGRAAAAVLVLLAMLGQLETRQTETDYPSIAAEAGGLLRLGEVGGVKPVLLIAVQPATEQQARTDVETDVRLLALLLAANATAEQLPRDTPVVLLEAPPITGLLDPTRPVVVMTAWRPVAADDFLPKHKVTKSVFFPSEGVRLSLALPALPSPASASVPPP